MDNRYQYLTDNYIAYKIDANKDFSEDLRFMNFVPIYDMWCLYCDNKCATKRCTKCKSVFFCDKNCQTNAWSIHKQHCGRDLFTLCSLCGKQNPKLKCDKCPVKFCDEKCKSQIYAPHKEFDCDYFSKTFK